jgi:AAA+ ATPase superfamily predicted ATPase
MDDTPFYGREEELERLELLRKKKTSSLAVVKGRRRIGKSRLILEFSKNMKTLMFMGLPPDPEGKTTAQMQREYFVDQMERQLGIRGVKADDWGDIFWNLAGKIRRGNLLVVLDEINWMGSLDDTFLGKLKTAWDLHFKNNPKLIMIFSGSMSSWIDENILSSTGFVGRISLELTLDELPLPICNLFWRRKAKLVSSYEKFKILSVMGGVPRYLEEIDPGMSAEDNILNLAFKKGGLLVTEFDRIFSDLFDKRSPRYKQIVQSLVDGPATLEQIADAIQLEKGGTVSEYLEDLQETGFVAQDNTWNIKTNNESNLCKFRLRDNYLRFYLKYIEPQLIQIEKNRIKIPPAWTTIMGFQFLIQMKYNTLYVFEIKFLKGPIGADIIQEMETKCQSIARPKGFSIRPILIHVNGVTDAVLESDYFSEIIDFGQFLE